MQEPGTENQDPKSKKQEKRKIVEVERNSTIMRS
jgi:hypothetical protein